MTARGGTDDDGLPGLVAVVAVGGVVGSLGRYAAGLALPPTSGAFAWSTFLVNVSGSLAMGILMAWIWTMDRPHPWLRPFLGVGVLGGWTTFSSFALDTHAMVAANHGGLAAAYVVGSLLAGLVAVALGVATGARAFAPPPARETT